MNLFSLIFGAKPAPVKPAPLSCFVAGLIRSINETPEKWSKWSDGDKDDHCIFSLAGIRIHYAPDNNHYPVIYEDRIASPMFQITAIERDALKTAIHKHLFGPFIELARQARKEEQAKEAARKAAVLAPFEKLGCPNQ